MSSGLDQQQETLTRFLNTMTTHGNKTVHATSSSAIIQVTSDHRLCAERRLVAAWMHRAVRHGVSRHACVTWIRRKAGSTIIVWRKLSDQSLCCAIPCVFCARVLQRHGFRVSCTLSNSHWYHGYLSDDSAPESVMTSRQKYYIRKDA